MRKDRKPTGRWPANVPGGETALDRAREIARAAVTVLRSVDAEKAEMIVHTADAFGETWLRVQLDNGADDDELLTASEAALLVGVRPTTIRKWAERGQLQRIAGKFRRGDVLDCKRDRDQTVMKAG